MQPSPKLTSLVKAICAKHGIDWQKEHFYLHLEMADSEPYLALESLGKERVSIGLYCSYAEHTIPEIEIVMWSSYQPEPPTDEAGSESWAAIEKVILYEGARLYVTLDENGEVNHCFDPVGQAQLARFADDWSEELLTNGWLEQGVAVEVMSDQSHRRIAGCQSANHTECYGELWQCASCGKTVCYAEGTDNLPELCDDCWIKAQDASVPSHPDIVSSTHDVTTVVDEDVHISRAMQQVIEEIAAKHNVDLSYYLAFLWLEKPDCDKRLIIERIDEWNISVALACEDNGTGRFIPDPDMIFLTLTSGWVPIAVYCSQAEWKAYLDSLPENGRTWSEKITPSEYYAFIEHWAKRIGEEDWLAEGVPQAEPPWEVQENGRWSSVCRPLCDNGADSEAEENDIPF